MLAAVNAEFIIAVILMPLLLALIGGPIMYLVKRLDDNNTSQHARSMHTLQQIHDSIDHVKHAVQDVKMDVTGVKMDISDVKIDVRDVQSDVKAMQKDVKVLDNRLTKHIEEHKHYDWSLIKKERV